MSKQNRHKDLDIVIQEREFLVPNELRDIAVQNDTNSEITKIIIPRYFDGNDLSKYSIMLKAVSKGGRSDFLFTEKETNVLEDKIELMWTLKTPMTSYSGTIKVQLSIFGEDFKWQTNQTEFNIVKSLDGEPIIPNQLDFVEKFIIQIEEKMHEAQTILDEVKSDVDTVKGQLERAEQVAEIIQSNEQSVSQNTQKVEQIKREIEQHKNSIEESVLEVQQIKDSTEIFYDIDEEGNRVGFRRANEETFTYTPSLKGEKGDVGDIGPQGLKGEQGERGLKGDKGDAGNGWLFGMANPRPTDGRDGDLYIQTTSYDIFKKKAGAWELAGNIKGLKGDNGETGPKGEKGDQGEQGIQGIAGTDGREIQLRRHETHVQYKYAGEPDSSWRNVIALEYITGPQGERGPKGERGERGETGLQGEAGQQGEQGLKGDRGDQGLPGENGKKVELQKSSTHVQWKYEGEQQWNDLIPLYEIKGDVGPEGIAGDQGARGPKGENGNNIQLKIEAGYIKWKYDNESDESWKNLVDIEILRGPKGDRGDKGDKGEKGDAPDLSNFYTKQEVYNKSEVDQKIDEAIVGGNIDLSNYYNKQQVDEKITQIELTPGPQGPKGDTGENGQVGAKGEDGKSVQLQKTSTHIQWKNTGEETWNNLIPLYEIKGDTGAEGIAGDQGPRGPQGPKGDIGEIGPAGPMGQKGDQGENGKNIELQKTQTHIQWKVEGESLWTDLVPLSELKGEKGDKGDSSTSSPEHVFITPETGFSIISNETKLYGNMMFVNVEVERTDKNYLTQGRYIQALKSPLALKPSSLSAVGSITGWFKIPSSAFAKDGSIAFTPTKDCVTAKITGWVMIQDE